MPGTCLTLVAPDGYAGKVKGGMRLARRIRMLSVSLGGPERRIDISELGSFHSD